MKGKRNKKRLKPILKKSMLTALGLGIALPIGGTLPQVNAGAAGSDIIISRPVLSEYIHWLNQSSEDPDFHSIRPLTSIEASDKTVLIDLSNHFPSEQFDTIKASSYDANNGHVAEVYVDANNKLVVIPYSSGAVTITITANHIASQTTVTDNIQLFISKQGDVNNDGKVNSADAAALLKHLRNELNRRSYSVVEMNRMDIDRDGEVFWSDPQALLEGYAVTELGAKDNRYVLTFKQVDDAPYALNAQLTGVMKYRETITSSFEALDVDGDEIIETSYQWYRSTDSLGENRVPIEGATTKDYTINSVSDVNRYLVLEITQLSNPNEQPRGMSVIIVGKKMVDPPA